LTNQKIAKIFSLGLIIPVISLALPQIISLSSFSIQLNILAASIAFVSYLIVMVVWQKGINKVLLVSALTLFLRGALIAFFVLNDMPKSDRLLAVYFIVGYHFLETTLVAIVASMLDSLPLNFKRVEI